MSVNQEARYVTSSARNVHNYVNRFRGVNTGDAKTRGVLLEDLKKYPNLTLEMLKGRLGVRLGDTKFDTDLQPIMTWVQSQKKKAPTEEKAPLDVQAAEVSEDPTPKVKFKKGNPDKAVDKATKKWAAKGRTLN